MISVRSVGVFFLLPLFICWLSFLLKSPQPLLSGSQGGKDQQDLRKIQIVCWLGVSQALLSGGISCLGVHRHPASPEDPQAQLGGFGEGLGEGWEEDNRAGLFF